MIQLQSVNVKKNATVHAVMGQKYTCPTVMSKLRDEGSTKGSSSLSTKDKLHNEPPDHAKALSMVMMHFRPRISFS